MDSGVVVGLVLAVLVWVGIKILAKELRRKRLIAKYGDNDLTRMIIAKKICQGMTSEQLVESWGRPEDIDEKILKTKTNETWKYGRTGKNRFNNRVYVENGIVIGWQTH